MNSTAEPHQKWEDYRIILLTIVKDDPEGLSRTFRSIADAVDAGLEVGRWLVKTSGPNDTSLDNFGKLPTYATVVESLDKGIYDALNQAVHAVHDEDPRAWVCLLNAGDQLHPDFVRWYVQRDMDHEANFGLMIGRAVTTDGAVIAPIAPIIGKGGLNFCHQAALFRRGVLTRFPFPTQLHIAGDYAHFLSLVDVRYTIIDTNVVTYDMTGLSERSVLATRVDNFKAGYKKRGILEISSLAFMLTIRAISKLQRLVLKTLI